MPRAFEKNYALRRVLYDTLVATKSLLAFGDARRDFATKESLKAAALIMARNLNAFFYHTDYAHIDDIHVGDFSLVKWTPDKSAALDKRQKMRINKLVGHVVTSRPDPFKSDQEVRDLAVPLIRQSRDFIEQCTTTQAAQYVGRAKRYARILNSLLPSLGLRPIPDG